MNVSVTDEVHLWVFEFERQFHPAVAIGWMKKHWTIAYYVVALYLALLYVGRRYMSKRSRFEIKGFLFFWNLVLSVFSVVVFVRSMPHMIKTVTHDGFHYSVCGYSEQNISSVAHFWVWAFVLSKVVELGDTAFIVLRKQPLFFLHWYHHVTVLLYTWYSYATSSSSGRWFAFINVAIHSMMYTYYMLKACSVPVPRKVAMTITMAQLSQMVFGCYITYYVYDVKRRGVDCLVSDANLHASIMLYMSYFCLFLWYFYQAYFAKTSQRSVKEVKSTKQE